MDLGTPLYITTPLVENTRLSESLSNASCSTTVLLKMDALQLSGSFKMRGIGHLCLRAAKERKCQHFVTSSGGNAGLAVAVSGKKLGVKVSVVVPETTPPFMRQKIEAEGAHVIVHGKAWDDADRHARSLLVADPEAAYVHPFDDADVWEGHTSLVTEIKDQINHLCAHKKPENVGSDTSKPDVLITCVGGGGLLCGVLKGLKRVGWADVPVIAMETKGADKFDQSMKKGELVTLPAITSIAKTLGALRACPEALRCAQEHPGHVYPFVVSDAQAVDACLQFLDDQRVLVEASCGAALSAVYSRVPPLQDLLRGKKSAIVVVIVCGGNITSLKTLEEWRATYLAKDCQQH